MSKHRCPIFNVCGVALRNLAPDVLHTLHFGCFKAYCCTAMWELVNQNVFGVERTTEDSRMEVTISRLRHALFAWYARNRTLRPISELADLTANMLGSHSKPHLSTKAGETSSLLEFLAEAMAKYQNKLGERGEALHELGKSLIELKRVYHESGWRLKRIAFQLRELARQCCERLLVCLLHRNGT